MNAATAAPTSTMVINGSRIELIDRGCGRSILFLHPHIGLDPSAPVLAMLAEGGRLIAPSHPGFGHSERPAGITTVDDLSYFYLDLMDALDLRDALVIGVSLGAWIAAAIAVKSTARMARLVLGNPVGIKVGDRETRDILDIFAMLEGEFIDKAFADPAAGKRDYRAMTDDEVTVVARNREAAALYTFARKRNKAVLCLAHVTNTMGLSDLDFEKGEADGTTAALTMLEALAKGIEQA